MAVALPASPLLATAPSSPGSGGEGRASSGLESFFDMRLWGERNNKFPSVQDLCTEVLSRPNLLAPPGPSAGIPSAAPVLAAARPVTTLMLGAHGSAEKQQDAEIDYGTSPESEIPLAAAPWPPVVPKLTAAGGLRAAASASLVVGQNELGSGCGTTSVGVSDETAASSSSKAPRPEKSSDHGTAASHPLRGAAAVRALLASAAAPNSRTVTQESVDDIATVQPAPILRRMGAASMVGVSAGPASMDGVSTPERPRRASEVVDPSKPTPSPVVNRRLPRLWSAARTSLPSTFSKAPRSSSSGSKSPEKSGSPGKTARQGASPDCAPVEVPSEHQPLKRKLLVHKNPKQKAVKPQSAKKKPLQHALVKRPASVMAAPIKQRKLAKKLLRKPASSRKAVTPASTKQKALPPLRQRRHGAWMQELRGLDLKDVATSVLSSDAVEFQGSESYATGRPRRCRFQVLNAWRNERVVYERLEGSQCPSVAALRINCAARPLNVMSRSIDSHALATPKVPLLAPQSDLVPIMDIELPPQQGNAKPPKPLSMHDKSNVATSTDRLEVKSTFLTLSSSALKRQPPWVALPVGAQGVLHVLSGCVRLRIAVSGKKTAQPKGYVLNVGDTIKLPGVGGQMFVAESGVEQDPSRVFYACVASDASLQKSLPLFKVDLAMPMR